MAQPQAMVDGRGGRDRVAEQQLEALRRIEEHARRTADNTVDLGDVGVLDL